MDSSLFSHPIAEEPRPGALTAPQESRYGNLFRQPVYTPAPSDDTSGPAPRQRGPVATWAPDPSGRR
ncbi:Uncharacterised protein [Amycolatopsis camponoti]|uniref:Uncharacterized protein n=1 Tax=Amycolatopsis camponoti TaxID=2606593 RepID=A0A6I8M3J4_9PSEU|nr:hypothetical protein [Amycolatopsis camponoti]VVJ22126.1 Uncharacterised protein [Amycolatopsis camponoti]